MSKTIELVKEINAGLQQKSASKKDEVTVMQSMLNDAEYKVGVYTKDGQDGTYCPAEEARSMIANIIKTTTKVPAAEAKVLADAYEFTKSDAEVQIGIAKEFVNTYTQTGRKLPLGGRETSSVTLERKEIAEAITLCPIKTGVDETGKDIYDRKPKTVPAHAGIKASNPCPAWCK